ncbi:MAG TPA: TetR/AcrR family transcriptional regulator [Nitrospirae bacterium]|nr:TetR/AcrR family transcriptional regulator [Nitrospirota bacterium]
MGRNSDAKQRIIDSAAELFHSRSYANVGVQEICEKANVKKGSFYHFFPSKRDLTLAVIDHIWLYYNREGPVAKAFGKDVPPLKRIERFFLGSCEFQAQLQKEKGKVCGCHFGNLASEISSQDEVIRKKLDEIFSAQADVIENTLVEAVAVGDLREIDTKAAANAILAFMQGIILMAKTRNDARLMRKMAKAGIDMIYQSG